MHNERTTTLTSNGYLLLLEDSAILGKLLLKWLAGTFPEKGVVVVATIAEAQQVIAGVNVDFILCTLELPDGDAVDFMSDVRTVDPNVPFVLMTGATADHELENVQSLQPIGIVKKPLNLPALEQMLRPHLEPQGRAPSDQPVELPPTGFSAVLHETKPCDIIQLKCLGGATTVLRFTQPEGGVGHVYLHDGQISHAETETAFGIEGLAEILRWDRAGARELAGAKSRFIATIGPPWQSALLEASHLADESAGAPPSQFPRAAPS